MDQKADYYHRLFQCVGDESGEVVIVISVEQIKRAGLAVGDELLVIASDSELVIRKK
ncbi:hypothetical protein P4U99_27635 [Brevibacillus agri]|uniref:hypothetical protein n=1 Tax=Brevibacillus TaxID=55080 RepID=UPI001EE4F994|nr:MULTISPECIES: hypothetical protein [Brevibacillus]MCG5252465.1 hypothetical protein [Brevibacillus agri]MCM3472199.1 hypothetical protein [Brevibacillus borstelensis]MED1646878.1 hypothetical protein [Brevibacillus agri]MED1657620.1 hypothetical protein [Brevibacillus agri]MED1690048.1 hypothetical protein [Brevibacillus agri]